MTLMSFGSDVIRNWKSAIAGTVRTNTRWQALTCTLNIALTGRTNTIIGIHM